MAKTFFDEVFHEMKREFLRDDVDMPENVGEKTVTYGHSELENDETEYEFEMVVTFRVKKI